MILHGYCLPLIWTRVELWLLWRTDRAHEHRSRLALELDHDRRNILIGCQAQDNSATYEVEIRVECVWIVELDADGHAGQMVGGYSGS